MSRCGHFLRDPRGPASTDPKGRSGWNCQRSAGHPLDPEKNEWHEDYKVDGSTSRRWSSEGLSPRLHLLRHKQQATPRMF